MTDLFDRLTPVQRDQLVDLWNSTFDVSAQAEVRKEQAIAKLDEITRNRDRSQSLDTYLKKLHNAEQKVKEAEEDADRFTWVVIEHQHFLAAFGEIIGIDFIVDDCDVCTGVAAIEEKED